MTQKSSDQLLESLSALVDNEANELEVRRILKNVETNPEVRDRWRSYNLIGSVLRKDVDLYFGGTLNVASGVAAALVAEQAFAEIPLVQSSSHSETAPRMNAPESSRKSLIDFIAKSAVAASFAGALVVGFNILSPDNSSELVASSGQLSAPAAAKHLVDPDLTAPIGFELPRLESRTVSSSNTNSLISPVESSTRAQSPVSVQMDDISDPATQRLLNELLIHHAARASANGSLGMMPYARVSQMRQVSNAE